MNGISAPIHHDKEFSLGDVLVLVLARWKWIALTSLVVTSLSVIYALNATPIYRAQAVIAPAAGESAGGAALARIAGQLGPLAGVVGDFGLGGGGSRKDVWLATLRSNAVIRLFIQEHDVMPNLFFNNWNAEAKAWRVKDGRSMMPTMEDAVHLFTTGILNVNDDKKTGLVTVAVDWRDPEIAARWANDLVTMTNGLIRNRAIEEAQRNIAYLEGELKKTNVVERQQIIFRLIESRTGEIMMANGRPEYAFTVIDRAVPADRNRPIKPKRRLIVLAGFGAALVLSTIAVIVVGLVQRFKHGSSMAALPGVSV